MSKPLLIFFVLPENINEDDQPKAVHPSRNVIVDYSGLIRRDFLLDTFPQYSSTTARL